MVYTEFRISEKVSLTGDWGRERNGMEGISWQNAKGNSGKILLHKLGRVFLVFRNFIFCTFQVLYEFKKTNKKTKAGTYLKSPNTHRPQPARHSGSAVSWSVARGGGDCGSSIRTRTATSQSATPSCEAALAFLPREFWVASEERRAGEADRHLRWRAGAVEAGVAATLSGDLYLWSLAIGVFFTREEGRIFSSAGIRARGFSGSVR